MDILNILNQLSKNNIDLGSLINIASNLFGNKQTQATSSNEASKNAQPPTTNFDMNNPYWSLPTYNNTPPQPKQNITPSPPTEQQQPNTQNNSNFIELLKIALPLLSKQKEKSQTFVEPQKFDSEILKLKKTK